MTMKPKQKLSIFALAVLLIGLCAAKRMVEQRFPDGYPAPAAAALAQGSGRAQPGRQLVGPTTTAGTWR